MDALLGETLYSPRSTGLLGKLTLVQGLINDYQSWVLRREDKPPGRSLGGGSSRRGCRASDWGGATTQLLEHWRRQMFVSRVSFSAGPADISDLMSVVAVCLLRGLRQIKAFNADYMRLNV